MRLFGHPRRNVARFNEKAGSGPGVEPLEGRTLLSVADFALDTAFGQGGRVPLDVAGEPSDATATPDGKLVVGGRRFLLRFNADGSRDAGFGDNGLVSIDRLEGVTRVAVQADGKVLAADETMEPIDDHDLYRNRDVGVMRFNADGTPDTSFGNNGMARLNFGGASQFAEHVAELIVTPRG